MQGYAHNAKVIYYKMMKQEIESVLNDKKNYYNYSGIPTLIEHWERERCSMFLTLMSHRTNDFPKECMYYLAFRTALLKRLKRLEN